VASTLTTRPPRATIISNDVPVCSLSTEIAATFPGNAQKNEQLPSVHAVSVPTGSRTELLGGEILCKYCCILLERHTLSINIDVKAGVVIN
jgi:hypothetical protein